MDIVDKDSSDEKLKTQIIEAILEYFEGNRTLRSILALGITVYNRKKFSTDSKVTEVVSQLNTMGNEMVDGKSFSNENIKETFTSMLEKLISE